MGWVLDLVLVVGLGLIVAGVALVSTPAALIVAGLLVTGITVLVHRGARAPAEKEGN